jgi:hypothetical protein
MTKLIEGFDTIMGSDVQRDGMYLELIEAVSGDEVAEVFYSDETRKMQISIYKQDLPREVIEQFIARAKNDLPGIPPPLPTRHTKSPRNWFTRTIMLIAAPCFIVVICLASRLFPWPGLEFADVTFIKEYDSINKQPYAYTVSGRVHNKRNSVLILPVFYVSLDEVGAHRHHCATGVLVPPGEWAYFSSGGVHEKPAILSRARRAIVSLNYSDGYTDPHYVSHQLRNRAKLHIDNLRFDPSKKRVSGRFRNESGRPVTAIKGTAIFFDHTGSLSECAPFSVTVSTPDFSFYADLEDPINAITCKLQVNTFIDSSQQTPHSVPVPPSAQ